MSDIQYKTDRWNFEGYVPQDTHGSGSFETLSANPTSPMGRVGFMYVKLLGLGVHQSSISSMMVRKLEALEGFSIFESITCNEMREVPDGRGGKEKVNVGWMNLSFICRAIDSGEIDFGQQRHRPRMQPS